ncbi:MAG TPA: regulatory protein RecX [Flavisolibacter sp.]|nr:regulatory protein RecX [Flavisolibacter sp.]
MQKSFTKDQAIQKLKHYCSYQERCHNEVKQKLWELRVPRQDHDDIISKLIEEDYLNEERFAKLFVGGRFRVKGWGKNKILYALKEKQISQYNIREAMKEVDEDEYRSAVLKFAEKKYSELKGEQYLVRTKKTMDYLQQKGFEPEIASQAINEIKKKDVN